MRNFSNIIYLHTEGDTHLKIASELSLIKLREELWGTPFVNDEEDGSTISPRLKYIGNGRRIYVKEY